MKRGEQAKLLRELKTEHGLKPSKTIISRMIKEKDYRIKLTPKGNIDIAPTIKALVDSDFPERVKKVTATIEARKGNSTKTETKKETSKTAATDPKEEIDIQDYIEDDGKLSTKAPRSVVVRFKDIQSAEKDRIKNETALKTLVDFNQTTEKVFNFLRPLRDDIQEIGKRVSAIAYQAGSKHEAEQVINAEINRIFLSRVGEDYKIDDDLKKKIIQVLKM